MNKLLSLASFAFICSLTPPAAADASATEQMKRLMTSPEERDAAIAKDPAALAADKKAAAVGGPAVKEKIYEIAADIAGTMAAKDGDAFASADKLKSTDPQALFNSLTKEQKEAIQQLAKEIEAVRK